MTNILPLMVLKGLGCGDHTGERERERERNLPAFSLSPSPGYTTRSRFPSHPLSVSHSQPMHALSHFQNALNHPPFQLYHFSNLYLPSRYLHPPPPATNLRSDFPCLNTNLDH